ncbi:SsrA-binding protein SmpB [Campylobacter sp. MIT 97-5078]|uniref:SsrA-binding protein SmpB n=1 Tax=Campylobacter sp. MIT 97-5078 TaxID=1548153 RepID=UPI0005134955|nr:SsrA-binding protein SmpB [Campylobacter sp. MIT 97-5078]KGI55525.1 single-stranded DNA-binding protein [Campylobacter sp. MIT 97-5078]TQR26981.1 SsrA-binding protein SmpB [Campylobacter sp. MIT 97-5078]
MKIIARNKKALFDYAILERFEAGMVLKGSEVVALRAGRANLKDSFVRVIKGELFLLNAHISHLSTTNSHFKHEERRARKLLMHRKQIDKLFGKVSQDGLTLVVLELYFNVKNKVKASLALAKGKTLHDKREVLKKKQADLEARAALKGI